MQRFRHFFLTKSQMWDTELHSVVYTNPFIKKSTHNKTFYPLRLNMPGLVGCFCVCMCCVCARPLVWDSGGGWHSTKWHSSFCVHIPQAAPFTLCDCGCCRGSQGLLRSRRRMLELCAWESVGLALLSIGQQKVRKWSSAMVIRHEWALSDMTCPRLFSPAEEFHQSSLVKIGLDWGAHTLLSTWTILLF